MFVYVHFPPHYQTKVYSFLYNNNKKSKVSPVPRAIHRFEGKGLLLSFKREHVFAVVLPVAWSHPQFAVVDVRRHHFLEAPFPVFTLQNKHQSIKYVLSKTHVPLKDFSEKKKKKVLNWFLSAPLLTCSTLLTLVETCKKPKTKLVPLS